MASLQDEAVRLKTEARDFFRDHVKPRLIGLLLFLLGVLLFLTAVVLMSLYRPEGDFYAVRYPVSQQLVFGLLAALGLTLMSWGLWRMLVGRDWGLWPGTLKGVVLSIVVMGSLVGAFAFVGIFAMLRGDAELSRYSWVAWGRGGGGGFDD